MFQVIFIVLALQQTFAYHDPDLNYHLSQVQQVSNCDNGYSYAAPALQLTTSGVKAAAPAATIVSQPIVSAPAYQYSGGSGYSTGGSASYSAGGSSAYSTGGSLGYSTRGNAGYSTGITYQAPAPKITYAAQPAVTYQTSSLGSNYAAQRYSTQEVHGYATSAGLSSAASSGRTVTPLATYAQAPIIAKVTAAPLIAKFSLSPAKTSYVTQNLIAQQAYSTGSLAKASLNSYSNIQTGGPVVSQVYAAPSAGYATSPALRVQQAQVIGSAHYSSPAVAQYAQYTQGPVAAPAAYVAPALAQYATSSVSHASAPSSQYFAPVVSQHSDSAISQYSAPTVTQHAAPAVAQYAAPVVQYSAPATVVQHSAPVAQYSAPQVASVTQYASAPVGVAQVSSPAYAAVGVSKVSGAALTGKNAHTEFLENYVSI